MTILLLDTESTADFEVSVVLLSDLIVVDIVFLLNSLVEYLQPSVFVHFPNRADESCCKRDRGPSLNINLDRQAIAQKPADKAAT